MRFLLIPVAFVSASFRGSSNEDNFKTHQSPSVMSARLEADQSGGLIAQNPVTNVDLAKERAKGSPRIYSFLADALEIMRDCHTQGFTLGLKGYSSNVTFGFSAGGRLVKECGRIHLTGTNIMDVSTKDDLSYLVSVFTKNGYTPLNRKQVDPKVLGFLDAVSGTRRDGLFDYDRWIRFFRHSPVETLPDQTVLPVNERIAEYWNLMETCMATTRDIESRLGGLSQFRAATTGGSCPPDGATISIDDGSISFQLDVAAKYKHGTTGVACPSKDGAFYLKSYSKNFMDNRELSCNEKSVLEVIQTVGDFIPRFHKLTPGSASLSAACQQVSLVVENAGPKDLGSVLHGLPQADKYAVFAKVLGLIRELHDAGFAHNDFYLNNVIIKDENDPIGSMTIIDYGVAKPICDIEGNPLVIGSPFKQDFLTIADRLKGFPEHSEFYLEMEGLGVSQRPRYEHWISVFTELSRM